MKRMRKIMKGIDHCRGINNVLDASGGDEGERASE